MQGLEKCDIQTHQDIAVFPDISSHQISLYSTASRHKINSYSPWYS